MQFTASELVAAIGNLPTNRAYRYIEPTTRGRIEIVNVTHPEGPIVIKRYDPSKGGISKTATKASISRQMIIRYANAISENVPANIDRVLGASYNTRSALEALLAHTPQFYYCYPKRIDTATSTTEMVKAHKHLVWIPNEPHELGAIKEKETDRVVSEMPTIEIVYENLILPPDDISSPGLEDIDVKRRHAQIQIALVKIGEQLGFRTWVAQNDKGIVYNNVHIGEMPGVIQSLKNENMIGPYDGAEYAARLIDCIWFKNGKLMPAVMEVEHTTGVTSGLERMKELQDKIPGIRTRYVIVAPDEDRPKVLREANKEHFRSLHALYFPYSAVEDLYALCQRRKIRGVTEEFLDSFMEPTIGMLQ